MSTIRINVNGVENSKEVEPRLTLVAQPDRVVMALMNRSKLSRAFRYGPIFESS